MGIHYELFNWQFDMEAFSEALQKIADMDKHDFAAVIGIDVSTLENWRSGDYIKRKKPYPSMTNFINACNWLDLDPREFFKLEDKK